MPKEADTSQTVGFRSLLLNKCQQEFEKDKVDELDIAERQKLIDEAASVSLLTCLLTVQTFAVIGLGFCFREALNFDHSRWSVVSPLILSPLTLAAYRWTRRSSSQQLVALTDFHPDDPK